MSNSSAAVTFLFYTSRYQVRLGRKGSFPIFFFSTVKPLSRWQETKQYFINTKINVLGQATWLQVAQRRCGWRCPSSPRAADLSCCLDAGELNSRYSCLVAQPKAHHSATLRGNTPALQRRSMWSSCTILRAFWVSPLHITSKLWWTGRYLWWSRTH